MAIDANGLVGQKRKLQKEKTIFDELSSESDDQDLKTAPETIEDFEEVQLVRVVPENSQVEEAAEADMETAEAQPAIEREVIATIDVLSIADEDDTNNDVETCGEATIVRKQPKDTAKTEDTQGAVCQPPHDTRVREAAETLAMLSKPTYPQSYNHLWFTRYDKAKMEAKMDKPFSYGMRQLAKLEVKGTAIFTGGFERPDTMEKPIPIWDIELIPVQIFELYTKKRVPRRLVEQPNWDKIKDERAALRTQRRIRPFRYSAE